MDRRQVFPDCPPSHETKGSLPAYLNLPSMLFFKPHMINPPRSERTERRGKFQRFAGLPPPFDDPCAKISNKLDAKRRQFRGPGRSAVMVESI